MATGNYAAAKEAYSTALKCDPTIRRSKSFKVEHYFYEITIISNAIFHNKILFPGSNCKI